MFGRYTELHNDVMRCLDAWVPVVLPGLMVRNRRSPGAVPRGIGDRAGMSSRLMLLFSRLCPFGCLSPRLLPSSVLPPVATVQGAAKMAAETRRTSGRSCRRRLTAFSPAMKSEPQGENPCPMSRAAACSPC